MRITKVQNTQPQKFFKLCGPETKVAPIGNDAPATRSSVKAAMSIFEQKAEAENKKQPPINRISATCVKPNETSTSNNSSLNSSPDLASSLTATTNPKEPTAASTITDSSRTVNGDSASNDTTNVQLSPSVILKPQGPKRELPKSFQAAKFDKEESSEADKTTPITIDKKPEPEKPLAETYRDCNNSVDMNRSKFCVTARISKDSTPAKKQLIPATNSMLNITSYAAKSDAKVETASSDSKSNSNMVTIPKADLEEIYTWMMKTTKEMEDMKKKIKFLIDTKPK